MIRLAAILLLTGCASEPERITIREPVEVKVPVPVACKAPDELLAPLEYDLPQFVPPTDPQAVSSLTAEGETALQRMLWAQRTRLEAWKAWAGAQ